MRDERWRALSASGLFPPPPSRSPILGSGSFGGGILGSRPSPGRILGSWRAGGLGTAGLVGAAGAGRLVVGWRKSAGGAADFSWWERAWVLPGFVMSG